MGMNVSGGDSQHNRGNTLSRKMQGCRIRSAGTTHRQLEWDARIQSRFSARAASRGLVMAVGSNSLICTPPPKAPWESVTANPGVSSAGGPSRTITQSGCMATPAVLAPRVPTSS